MNEIIRSEAAMRLAPQGGVTAVNAGAFLEARIRAGRLAVDSFRRLDTSNVDAGVVALSNDLREWYENGVRVSRQARQLLGSDSQARQGSAGLAWQTEEKQHNAAVQKLNQKGAQLRNRMERRYKVPFPPLE